MTKRWWIYVFAFLVGVALTVGGLAMANSLLLVAGIIIGIALFFSRKFMT